MSLFSSISPLPSNRPSRRASFSPMGVTSILNSMYAHPPSSNTHEGQSSAGSHDWAGGSQGHYTLRRMKSQEELARLKAKAPRLADRPKTSAGGGSRSASRRFIASIEPPQASSPTDSSASPPRQLSPSESRVSNETSSTSSTLRLVGRGGCGSKYRVVAPKPPTLDINELSKPVVACEAQPPPPEAVPFHRPTGRGGVGARKKSYDTLPAPVLSRLPLKRVLSTKFRKDSSSGKSVRSVESIPESSTSPQLPHHISTGSLSTFHTTSSDGIHHSPRSIPEGDDEIEEFLDGYLPPLSPSSSTFEGLSTFVNSSKHQFHILTVSGV
ncbi:hypothetical protein BJ165DRAFT_262414 [Panaeolus papilionaceus]|nr:hypothetical protein BJ165DRAFT_262414 [Panaeolus papilionaceus]